MKWSAMAVEKKRRLKADLANMVGGVTAPFAVAPRRTLSYAASWRI